MDLDCSSKPKLIRCCNSRKHLPDDILMDILSRLPDKPLVRLKCLSKTWYYLISRHCIAAARPRPIVGLYFRTKKLIPEMEFILLNRAAGHPALNHFASELLRPKNGTKRLIPEKKFVLLNRAAGHPALNHFASELLRSKNGRKSILGNYASLSETGDDGKGKVFEWGECLSNYVLPFVPDPDDLIDCCNGLLLFFDLDSCQYYVSNPLTRQSVLIPRPSWIQQRFFNAALVFDPCKSTSYKVVRYDRSSGDNTLFLDIYSSCNRSWSRHSVEIGPRVRDIWHRASTYFNGALYRLSFLWHLVQIDLERITVHVTDLPLTSKQCEGLFGCIGVLMGQLCYANEDTNNVLLIWSFEKDICSHDSKGRWTLRHSINIYDLTRDLVLFREYGDPDTKWVGPIAFDPSSNTVFLGSPLVILSYNLDTNMLQELIRIERDAILPGCYCPAFTYVRYLAPFNEEGSICPGRLYLEM